MPDRVTLNLSERAQLALERLKTRQRVNTTDALNTALVVYERVTRDETADIVIRHEDGTEETLVIV
jgi:hypothetical protein